MSQEIRPSVLTVLAGVIFLVLIQIIPYGKYHTNPPVIREPSWDSAATRALAKRACFDCHSHETIWPWHSRVAPMSWLVQHDVDKGREELNFSDWQDGAHERNVSAKFRKEIAEGGMPPLVYRLAHKEARLPEEEKRRLIDGLTATSVKK